MIQLFAFILIIFSVHDLCGTGRSESQRQRKWQVNSSDGGTWHHMQACTPAEKSENRFHTFKFSTPDDFSPKTSPSNSPKSSPLLAPKKTINKRGRVASGSQRASQPVTFANSNQNIATTSIVNNGTRVTSPVIEESTMTSEELLQSINELLDTYDPEGILAPSGESHSASILPESNQIPEDCSILFEIAGESVLLKNSVGVNRERLFLQEDRIVYFPADVFEQSRTWDLAGNEITQASASVSRDVAHQSSMYRSCESIDNVTFVVAGKKIVLENSAGLDQQRLQFLLGKIAYITEGDSPMRYWDLDGKEYY